MGKRTANLAERLRSLEQNNSAHQNRANLAVFLALKAEIQQALDEGWSARACWDLLYAEKKVPFSYQAFCRYVRRHLHDAMPVDGGTVFAAADQAAARPSPAAAPAAAPIHEMQAPPGRGFRLDPAPDAKELL